MIEIAVCLLIVIVPIYIATAKQSVATYALMIIWIRLIIVVHLKEVSCEHGVRRRSCGMAVAATMPGIAHNPQLKARGRAKV